MLTSPDVAHQARQLAASMTTAQLVQLVAALQPHLDLPPDPGVRWDVEDTAHHFRHRLVRGDLVGGWATYGGIARLEIGGRVYAACTTAFEGSLPIERVFEIR